MESVDINSLTTPE